MIAEEVQEIVVEPIIISKQQNIARRNFKLVNWLKLLSLHDQNKNLKAGSEVIRNQIHQNFIMQEAFWITEINKRFAKAQIQKEDIDLVMLGVEDGAYFKVGNMIADKVLDLYKQKKISENYGLSILQKLITIFSYEGGVGSFFRKMREFLELKGDIKKVRGLFEREMKLAHDNFDLVWDQYTFWETDKDQLEKNKYLYEYAKKKWQKQVVDFDQNQCCQGNVKLTLAMMQSTNQSKIDENKYMQWVEKLPTEAEKLWFLRRMALNFRQLIKQYLVKLQAIYSNDDQLLIKKYKVAIRLSENNKHIQLKYLHFLVRRISRHLLNQQLEEDYNDTWSTKVVLFRQEIGVLIEKSRIGVSLEQTKAIHIEYYKLWLEVETNIVKDKASISQLYESILKQSEDNTLFEDYAKTLMRLGSPKQAKNVLKRYMRHANNDRSRELYLSFIQMYGTIEDQQQFYKQEKTRITAQQSKTKHLQIEHEYGSLIHKSNGNQHSPHQSKHQSEQGANEQNKFKRERAEIKDQVQEQIQAQPKKRIHVDQNTIYIKGIPTSWTQQEVRNILTNQQQLVQIRLVVKNNQQRDYCYVVYNSKQAAEEEVKNNKSGYKLYISRPPSDYDQSSTLFLCALPLSANQQKIRALFEDYQKHIKQIRLKLSNEKNYVYVQFQSQSLKEEAFQSVNKSNLLIDGKKILMQYCDSSKTKSKKHSQNHVAFLKSLSFKTTADDIRQYFAGKQLLAINIPTNQEKRPKGFAYVEFEKEKDLQQALEAKKGVMHGRQFQIVRSDREITTQKHHESGTQDRSQSRNKNRNHPDEKQRNERNEKRNNKRQSEKAQNKDNSYFSSLFK